MKNQTGIELEIYWTRLIAIVDEVGASLQRTCFSTIVREGYDFACVLMDASGNSMAQSTQSVPSFIGTLPLTCKQVIRKYSLDGFERGDVIVTNDPWIGTGHLPDLTMVTPVFVGTRLVAFAGSVIHLPDIGGGRFSAKATEIFEEGLRIPISKLMACGEMNETLVNTICANVRVPDQVMADIQAQLAANELAAGKLAKFMQDHSLDDLSVLGASIHSRSESAMRNEIRKIPDGKYAYSIKGDGYDEAIEIRINIDIKGENICVDYSGTSPQSRWGINSVLNYTYAYTVYPLKCVLDPDTPNNEGCFRPIEVRAPEGSLLNPRFPASVAFRHVPGHLLQALIFGSLAEVIPTRIQADSGLGWVIGFAGADTRGNPYATSIFLSGGQGARSVKDGTNTLIFPSNTSNTPIEVLEAELPLIYEEKSLITDSGGAGRTRGGCGERVVLRSTARDMPITVSLMTDRIVNPPLGFGGGRPGRKGFVESSKPGPLTPKGRTYFDEGDILVLELPGGGGLGDPLERELDLISRDVAGGYVSHEQAREVYGVTIDSATGNFRRQ